MSKRTIIFSFFLLWLMPVLAQQTISVDALNQPLSQVLVQLRDQHDVQLSFNDNKLSKYRLTLNRQFRDADEAILYLFRDLPFEVKKTDEVFIIIPLNKKKQELPKPVLYSISGQVFELGSLEPLPFSHILINNQRHLVSDVNGVFSYTASSDSSFRVKVSHLGYSIFDTLLFAGNSTRLMLSPSFQQIAEIKVRDNLVERAALIGTQPGNIKLNHIIARFLPGQGDNSVFNLLRLMPGIQAAGEQATDLIIWGSYEGHSQITFDGFTLFGLKNYNDNISVVNPFMVKNIEIFKGAYDARYGNRVGEIVNITGINGNRQKPTFSFNVNTTTLNALAEVPVFKKSSLAIAYRQTFYNLYNASDFNVFAPTRPSGINGRSKINNKKELTDVDVYPEDYLFRDLNLKYTINFDNGNQFFLSAYGGGDRFNLKAETDILWSPHGRSDQTLKIPYHVNFENNERNMQRGISATYNRVWNNRVQSRFVLSHSDYEKSTSEKIDLQNTKTGLVNNGDIHFIANQTVENSFRVENNISLRNAHQIETGGGFYDNGATLSDQINFRNQAGINYQMNFQSSRFFLYVQDVLPIGNRITLNSGARANWAVNSEKLYVEPRLSASIKASETLKVHAAWGIYNQFAYKLANVDMDNNYTWLWVTASEKNTVLHATHWVGGINYHYKSLTFNVDGYFKTTRNLTRRELVSQNNNASANRNYATIYGVASTYGIDAFVKKDFGQHSVWASYTLSKAEERMAPVAQVSTNYTLAPHDQRHELKIAALFKAGSFYFSGNYVYGSEMQIMRELFPNELENISYNRFDIAITYNFNGKLKGETGFSVLNVFDIYNLKYANLKNINIAQNLGSVKIYTGAVPFTPILFLKMVF